MKTTQLKWLKVYDYYYAYFSHKSSIWEINVKEVNNKLLTWIYNQTTDEEIIDEEVDSLFEVNGIMRSIFRMQINLPDLNLLKNERV